MALASGATRESSSSASSPSSFAEPVTMAATLDGAVYALDGQGRRMWSFSTGGPLLSSVLSAGSSATHVVPSLDGNVYIYADGHLQYAVNARDLTDGAYRRLDDGTVIINHKETRLTSVRLRDGHISFSQTPFAGDENGERCDAEETDDGRGWCSREEGVDEDMVIVGRATYFIHGVDEKTGVERWNISFAELFFFEADKAPSRPPLASAGDPQVHAGLRGSLAFHHPSGDEAWRVHLSAPAVAVFDFSRHAGLREHPTAFSFVGITKDKPLSTPSATLPDRVFVGELRPSGVEVSAYLDGLAPPVSALSTPQYYAVPLRDAGAESASRMFTLKDVLDVANWDSGNAQDARPRHLVGVHVVVAPENYMSRMIAAGDPIFPSSGSVVDSTSELAGPSVWFTVGTGALLLVCLAARYHTAWLGRFGWISRPAAAPVRAASREDETCADTAGSGRRSRPLPPPISLPLRSAEFESSSESGGGGGMSAKTDTAAQRRWASGSVWLGNDGGDGGEDASLSAAKDASAIGLRWRGGGVRTSRDGRGMALAGATMPSSCSMPELALYSGPAVSPRASPKRSPRTSLLAAAAAASAARSRRRAETMEGSTTVGAVNEGASGDSALDSKDVPPPTAASDAAMPPLVVPGSTGGSRYRSEFEELCMLGKGAYGSVFKARNKLDGREYAIKKVRMSATKFISKVLREVKVVANLDHPCCLRYYAAWVEPLAPGTSLREELGLDPEEEDTEEVSSGMWQHVREASFDASSEDVGPPPTVSSVPTTTGGLGFVPIFPRSSPFSSAPMSGDEDDDVLNDGNVDPTVTIAFHRPEGSGTLRLPLDWDADSDSLSNRSLDSVSELSASDVTHILYMQVQLCELDTLRSHIVRARDAGLDVGEALMLFHQIVSGIAHVHSRGIIHRDVSPANIFLTRDKVCKIGDFGLSKYATTAAEEEDASEDGGQGGRQKQKAGAGATAGSREHTLDIGTPMYCAPEAGLGAPTTALDIFSLGIILVELLQPFSTGAERVAALMAARDGVLPEGMVQRFPEESELARAMLSQQPSERPTANEILALEFVAAHANGSGDGSRRASVTAATFSACAAAAAAAAAAEDASSSSTYASYEDGQ